MRVTIRNHAIYTYAESVGFSPHTFRLFPRQDHAIKLDRFEFQTNAGADVQYRRDLFDNIIALGFYPEKGTQLRCDLSLELEIAERNPFHFLLAQQALKMPFQHTTSELRLLESFLALEAPAPDLPFWTPPGQPEETVSTLLGLLSALHHGIAYERREEGPARSAAETVRLGSGACRDMAVLLAATLRRHGIAARLASGFLCEFGVSDKKADGALHAWTEAYLPGAGWVGLDATNGVLCDHCYICTAVGIDSEDVAPVQGSYYSDHHVPSTMEATVEISQIHLTP